jgi:hypothetical protein
MIIIKEEKTWYGTHKVDLWIDHKFRYSFEFKNEIDVRDIKYYIKRKQFGKAMNVAKWRNCLPPVVTPERSLN